MDFNQLRQSRWARRTAAALASVVALWAVAWLAVPPLVKSQAEKAAGEKLGRKVTIGSVGFTPWTLELAVHDLAIADAQGSSPQLRIKRIYIDGELQSLLRLAPVIDEVAVEEPVLKLTHLGGGKYDIDDVLAKLAPAPGEKPGEPQRFAFYNLALSGGSVDFSDRSVSRTHELRDLRVSVPFLSNLASHREVKTEPRLAFRLNGSQFDSAAQGTPFAQTRHTDARIKLSGMDLAPYLGYMPASVPVKLRSAVLDADLQLVFEQAPKVAVKLAGVVGARGVKTATADGRDLLSFDLLRLTLEEVRPLEQSAKLALVELNQPSLNVVRDRTGRINVDLGGPTPSVATGSSTGTASSGGGWQVAIGKVAVRSGSALWSDDTTRPAASIPVSGVSLDAAGFAWPMSQPMQLNGSAGIDKGSVTFSGLATAASGTFTGAVAGMAVQTAAPYASQFLEPTASGSIDAQFGVQWSGAGARLELKQLAAQKLALNKGRETVASIQKLELADAWADLSRKQAGIGRLALAQPKVAVQRHEGGQWMFERWLKAQPPSGPTGAGKPWVLAMDDFSVSGAAVSFSDRSLPRPVALEISSLQMQLKKFSTEQGRAPSPLSVTARVAAGQTQPGTLAFRGAVGLAPLAAQGTVDAVHLPLHAMEPYFSQALNIELVRADASFKGRVRYADTPGGASVRVAGDAALEDFRANSVQVRTGTATTAQAGVGLQISEELLSWKTLGLRGLDVSLVPGTATAVNVRETVLSDFFARVIVNENGRINLQDIVKASVPAGVSSSLATTGTVATPAPAANPPAPGAGPVIAFGPVNLVNGKVFFSDRFVRPNYSANLSELTGQLSAFSSAAPDATAQLADLNLAGRAEGTASLEVAGKLNPLAKPLALDIQGKVRDLELPPLSPYAIKYAGHGIERGKLSMDVRYTVKPDGQLTASNNLVLNQLSFGDKVEGAPNSLPVKLAVALLADRNGVIDINLPISGSLNDPQFSLGPVIFKVIVNLVVKAITAPFSLLAGAFGGGGEELSAVSFPAGSAQLQAPGRESLDKVAKALGERPSLRMTVIGTANLQAERDAFKRERLKSLVQAEKRRVAVLAGQSATGVITVGEAEYPALLKEVYRRADMPKPRNLIGLARDIPAAEMETLLLAHLDVSEDLVRELALQRAVAVKDYLASRQLPAERLFLGAVRTSAPQAGWSPRAELNLSMK